tara:strand:- start:2434 stop:3333 length:900 start_codon:yes stop_codon:yes gene_type:complete
MTEKTSKTLSAGNEILKYPLDIGGTNYPFMHIKINERQGKADEGFVTDIFTYIPIGIFQNDGMSYGNLERGLIGSGIEALTSGSFTVTGEDLMAAAGQFTSSLQNFTGVDMTGGYNAGVAKAGVAMNPSAVTTFESSEIRTFDINLKFITESKEESQRVKTIINRIREFMYPEKVGTFALQYPATFEIRFYAPVNGQMAETTHMPVFMPAYCTGLQTTYNASHSSFHPDGAPVEVDCQLSFRETHQLTREELNARMSERGISTSDALDEEGTIELSDEMKEELAKHRAEVDKQKENIDE